MTAKMSLPLVSVILRVDSKRSCFSQRFLYKLRKKTLFLKESVVHPFVQFKGQKNGFFLYEEYFEVLNYVDSNELSRI